MKAFSSKQVWLRGTTLVCLLAICSIAVHPSGPVKRSDRLAVVASELRVAPQVGVILKRSCIDCHSNQTVWPWYSYLAPMSWLVERDVRQGRDRMNLSEWQHYTFEQQARLLADVAAAVKNHEMPLPQYVAVHRHAKLSDADTDLLYGWARAERRRVKAVLSGASSSASQPLSGY